MSVQPTQRDGVRALAPGATFAGYRVEEAIGEGGVGVVYRATRLAVGRPVALKMIADELAEHPPFRRRLERETRLAASIHHPGIVPVYEVIDGEHGLVLAMRYVAGTSLQARIDREGALAADHAVEIVEQVANALDAAHRRGLAHGDVKSAHVRLADGFGGYACLTDFGVSTLGASSLPFLAPEAHGGDAVGGRSDVYALGCVLFHALAGRTPFAHGTDIEIIRAHLAYPPPALSAACDDVPAALDAVVSRALSKRPEDRHASAGELAAVAAAALHGRARRRRPTPPVEPAFTRRPAGPFALPLARRSWRVAQAVFAGVLIGCTPAVALVTAGIVGGGGDEPTGSTPASARREAAAPSPPRQPTAPARRHGSPTVAGSIHIGARADGIATAGNDVWVAAPRDKALVRVDARTSRITARVRAGLDPDSVAAGKGTVWVTSRGDGVVRRFTTQGDPAPAETITVGAKPEGVALTSRLAWVLSSVDDTVTRIDRGSATRVGRPTPVGDQPIELATGPSGVWITNDAAGTVSHIDATTGSAIGAPIRVGGQPKGIAEGLGSVWVASGADDTVTRIDPGSGRVVGNPIRVGDQPSKVAVGAGLVWVTNFGDDTVTRIDPRTSRPVGDAIRVGRHPVGIAYGARHIWVASLGDGTVTKIRP